MSNILLVQAVIVATSGRMYKTKPREFREGGADLHEWQSALRSDLRLGQFPIDFVNDHGHEQTIMPSMVETIIFNTLGVRPEHLHTEPNYEALKAGWQEQLQRGPDLTEDQKAGLRKVLDDPEQTQAIPVVPIPPMPPTPPAQPAAEVRPRPVPKPGPPPRPAPAGSATGGPVHNADGSVSYKFATPHPTSALGPFDIRSETTHEMRRPLDLDSDDPTIAQRTVERAFGALLRGQQDRPSRTDRGRRGAPRPRSGQKRA